MEIVQGNHSHHGVKGIGNDLACSTEPSEEYDLFGEQKILPRVGDQYQADLPPLITELDPLCSNKRSIHTNNMDVVPIKFSVGLPLSLMWVANKCEKVKHETAESPSNSIGRSDMKESLKSKDCKPKVESVDVASDVSKGLAESVNLHLECETKAQKQRVRGDYLVPGFSDDTWNDIEQASFLLGLYIFGKNLVQVQQFIESKRMGDILSFYYGKFYKSESYCRWSECRKTRSRKCIYGQKNFTGPRQQELLSRLAALVSDECHGTLQQVTKTFREGKMSLEEYVFSLKTTAGLTALISAVGIGKGKEDLTGIAVESPKSDQVSFFRSEIPVGKACSNLTPLEIIKFLSGNYRLSKARSSDLFWEAVWPRLLARGWHSEQPSDHFYAAGSHSLVFLIPGVKKFSRRKLVKGKHYFDSVSDVLQKVASDPGLLELETGAAEENIKEEGRCCNETKLENHESANSQSQCYIKPCTPNHVAEFMKFTVVDTSLANGGNFKVRELRSLPVEMNSCHSQGSSDETGEESSEESHSTGESDSANSMSSDKGQKNCLKHTKISSSLGAFPNTNAANDSIDISLILCDGNTKIEDNTQPRKTIRDRTEKRKRPSEKVQGVPFTKQPRRSKYFSHVDAVCNSVAGLKTKQLESNCFQGNLDLHSVIVSSQDVPEEQKLPSFSSSGGSPSISSEVIVSCNCATASAENLNEEVEPQTQPDLNLYVHTDARTDQSSMTGVTGRDPDLPTASAGDANELKPSAVTCRSELLPNMNARRHSTRNRPLTTKALEALACGFLSARVKKKQRGSSPSKAHVRGRKRTKNKMFDCSIVNPRAEGRGTGVIEEASGLIQMEMGPDLGIFQLVDK